MPTVYTPPVNTYTALATTSFTSDSSITFSSIPTAGYRDLLLVFAGNGSGTIETLLRFNSDSGANYPQVGMRGLGSGSGTSAASTETAIYTYGRVSTVQGVIIYQIMDYAQTDKHKTVLVRGDTADHSTAATAARWASLNAINTLTFSTASGSVTGTLSLYGIA